MTLVVAVRQEEFIYLYSDTRVCSPMYGILDEEKVFEAHGVVWGFSGDIEAELMLRHASFHARRRGEPFLRWWNGHAGLSFKKLLDKHAASLEYNLIVVDKKRLYASEGSMLFEVTRPYWAIGAGAQLALGIFAYAARTAGASQREPFDADKVGACLLRVHPEFLFEAVGSLTESVGPRVSAWEISKSGRLRKRAQHDY